MVGGGQLWLVVASYGWWWVVLVGGGQFWLVVVAGGTVYKSPYKTE